MVESYFYLLEQRFSIFAINGLARNVNTLGG